MSISRRSVLGGLSALATASATRWMPAQSSGMNIPEKMTILFQGDSITDGGRNRAAYYPNDGQGMGLGYVRHIVTELLGGYPGKKIKVYNRGISGNKVFQLSNRWEDDCLMLKPDLLSIMIGVNDFWHTLDGNYKGTASVYENDYIKLMDRTKKALPNVKLIVLEPFVLHEGTSIKADKWRGSFEDYQAAAKRVSDRFGATFVPLQQIFDVALESASTSYWCPDGVHPSMAGNYLMAEAWIKAFKSLMTD